MLQNEETFPCYYSKMNPWIVLSDFDRLALFTSVVMHALFTPVVMYVQFM
jgi:hypothetical protein